METLFLIFRHPLLLLLFSFVLLSLSSWIGATRLKSLKAQVAEQAEDYRMVEGATLTLLGLIIGFTFAMAVSRYDQRKNYEEAEANAIGTEYVRADLLPAGDAARVRKLLLDYLDQRVLFYTIREERQLAQINASTDKLEAELWSAVRTPASAQPTAVVSLAVAGMNDVLNSQGYTQAAWLNSIPTAAWALLVAIAIGSSLLVGLGAKAGRLQSRVLLILPLILSVAFFLIADIDSPRYGMIKVSPQNLLLLSKSLRGT
ncbi:MAG TPA: hypothetical protein VEK05_02355 [Burkholderiales bacterium]|nr:hypothetical protein [Burkholderiales bacterium]